MDKTKEMGITGDERVLAALAHGGIVIGIFTSGFGGIVTALAIWITQKDKSVYVAQQSLQALLYQSIVFLLTSLAFMCWGLLWFLMLFPAITADYGAYQSGPPVGIWFGMMMMIFPCGFWLATFLYGLWGAFRCYGGHDFKYAFIGNWLERRNQ